MCKWRQGVTIRQTEGGARAPARQELPECLKRQHVIDRYMSNRTARHLIVGGIGRILNEREAAAAF